MSEHTLGELRLFPYDAMPPGWMPCDGQSMPIGDNQALYSLLGNTFGGDHRETFALPDLRGKVPIGTDYEIERGTSHPSFGSESGDKQKQPTIALVYAICVQGRYPWFD